MTQQLTDHEKAQLAEEEKRAKTWIRIQAEEAARLAEVKRAESASRMSAVEFNQWCAEQIAKGDAAKRAAVEQAERDAREQGALMRQQANG